MNKCSKFILDRHSRRLIKFASKWPWSFHIKGPLLSDVTKKRERSRSEKLSPNSIDGTTIFLLLLFIIFTVHTSFSLHYNSRSEKRKIIYWRKFFCESLIYFRVERVFRMRFNTKKKFFFFFYTILYFVGKFSLHFSEIKENVKSSGCPKRWMIK